MWELHPPPPSSLRALCASVVKQNTPQVSFRLTTLFYVFAVVASSLAAFGPPGLLVAFLIIAFWFTCYYSTPTRLVLVVLGILVVLYLLLPRVQTSRDPSPRVACVNHLKQLALSVIQYHEWHKQLPTPSSDSTGTGNFHSWRVSSLPYIEQSQVHAQYRFDAAWDSPFNSSLVPRGWDLFECPSHAQGTEVQYFAVVGPQTAWGSGKARTFEDVTDGLANTLLLIEAAGRGIAWNEPRDLTFDEAVELLTSPIHPNGSDGHTHRRGYFYKPSQVRNVAMCDGSVQSLPVPLPRDLAVAILTANGGETFDPDELYRAGEPELDYGVVTTFAIFVLIATLPAWRWLRGFVKKDKTTEATEGSKGTEFPNQNS